MLTVVVPTYNERENIRPLVERTLAVFDRIEEPCELLFVDDASPDGTADEIRAAARDLGASETVRVLVRSGLRDLAGAVADGFRASRGDVLACMDADLSHPPETLPALLAPIRHGAADMTIGSRCVPGGGISNWPLTRRLVSRFAQLLARPLVPVRDTTSGFFMIAGSHLAGIELRARGYKIGLEVAARTRNARILEVGFVFTDRRHGRSKLACGVVLTYLAQLASLYRERRTHLVRVPQFLLVAAAGLLAGAVAFDLALHYLGLTQLGPRAGGLAAGGLSFLTAAVIAFALNRAWTFRERGHTSSFLIFLAVSAGAVAFYFLTREVIRVVFGGAPVHAVPEVLASLAAAAWGYLGTVRWAFPPDPAGERPDPLLPASQLNARAVAIAVILVTTLLRLLWAASLDLAADEAYYWQWSRHLDRGFFDHPPFIAYLIAAGARLTGSTELGVRLLTVLLASAGAWILFRLAAEYGRSAAAGAWAVGLFAAAPLFAAGALIASPDAPMIFFWIAALWFTLRALQRERTRDWLCAGFMLGFGLLAKYPMFLLPVSIFPALLLMPRGRRALRTAGPWLAAAVALLIVTPHMVWLVSNGFQPVLFQLGHGLGEVAGGRQSSVAGITSAAQFVAAQIGVMGLLLIILPAAAVVKTARSLLAGKPEQNNLSPLLLFPALVTFGVFLASSFLTRSEANWAAPAYVSAFVLAGAMLAQTPSQSRRRAWRFSAASLALAAALTAAAHLEVRLQVLPISFDKIERRDQVTAWVESLLQTEEGDPPQVLAHNYQLASLLAFYLPGQPFTDAPTEHGSGSQYHAWRTSRPSGGEALFITTAPAPPDALFTGYSQVGTLVPTRESLLGDPVTRRQLHAFRGALRERPGPGEPVRDDFGSSRDRQPRAGPPSR